MSSETGSPNREARSARGRPAALLFMAVTGALLAACDTSTSTITPDLGMKPVEADLAMSRPDMAVEAQLQPGMFESPLIRLKRLQGVVSHMHVDEVRYRPSDKKLFYCAYTFGVLDASTPANTSYLTDNNKHKIPNDSRAPGCIHLSWDDTNPNIVYTTHRGNLSNPNFITGWDLSKVDMSGKITPVQLPVLQEKDVSYEGVDVANGNLYVALNDKGLGVYRRDAMTNAISRVGLLANGLGSAWGVVARDKTVFVTDQYNGMAIIDASDPTAPKIIGTVATGGIAHGLVVDGNTAYVAAGSVGVVVIDVSDLTRPRVIGKATMPGSAERVDYSGGNLFVAAWNDARVYDVSAPAQPRFIGAVRITEQIAYPEDGHPDIDTRNLGVAGVGNTMFVGNWYVPYVYQVHADRVAPNIRLPEEVNLIDFGPVAAGMTQTHQLEVTNQGTATLTAFSIWTEGTAFTVTPRQLQLKAGESAKLTINYRATNGTDKETSLLHVYSDDPAQPVRMAWMVGNQPGVSIGKALPPTRAAILDGTEFDSAQVQNKVMVLAYFATF